MNHQRFQPQGSQGSKAWRRWPLRIQWEPSEILPEGPWTSQNGSICNVTDTAKTFFSGIWSDFADIEHGYIIIATRVLQVLPSNVQEPVSFAVFHVP